MPATVYIRFDVDAPVRATPRRLHAAWGHVLDLPAGLSPARAQRLPGLAHRPSHDAPGPKPYCLGQLDESPGTIGMELRFLNDRLLDTLDAWLAWGGVLPIGDGAQRTVLAAALEAQVLQQSSWEELSLQDTATAWNIQLLSPTVFTTRGRHGLDITPTSLATSLHSRWLRWSPHTAPTLPGHTELQRLLAIEDRTHAVTVGLGMPRSDGRGRLADRHIPARAGRLRICGPTGAPATAVFSQLMALARYTNVGSHTSYGMGVIDVIPDPAC
ncbi:CRISPR system precrRNA processing endoribonuclease RAMP protein Cas6 [Actinomyces qiguomingii]|uniref:CRISPR system precrRNA processing endoribonuclease RAMP protein Cas6 n=1 Tax=Actinomyces qiguomingii TaxID=2057800 RepID=UPI000CA034EC|nr:CRISPR system precrRNA processing endoribonuclease RAMP protein Cas6 [Actinomyces qiguomingii]